VGVRRRKGEIEVESDGKKGNGMVAVVEAVATATTATV